MGNCLKEIRNMCFCGSVLREAVKQTYGSVLDFWAGVPWPPLGSAAPLMELNESQYFL